MEQEKEHGPFWAYMPLVYILILFIGVGLFDQIFPVQAIQEKLRETHPHNARWAVGLSFSGECANGECSSSHYRAYLLVPDSFTNFTVYDAGVSTGTTAYATPSGITTLIAVLVYGYLLLIASKEVAKRTALITE